MSSCHDEDLLALARGELPPDRAQERTEHVAGCAACAEELDALRADLAMFQARAARTEGPPLATWHGVARRVAAGGDAHAHADADTGMNAPAPIPIGRKSSRRTAWFAAGAVVAAAAGIVAVLKPRDPRDKGGTPPPTLVRAADADAGSPSPAPGPLPGALPGDQAIDQAVGQYEQAIQTLERDYAARRPSLAVARRARYDAQFAKMRGVVTEAKKVAGRDVIGRRHALKAYAGYMRTLQTVLLEEEEG